MQNVIQLSHTATSNAKFALTYGPLWCREVNIHVLTNAARYADTNVSSADASIAVGNGVSFQDINLQELFFMNTTAGSNTTITAVANKMTPNRMKTLGVG